ncbi:MAG: hypothetical protein AAF826_09240 [Pseudomonadota bacterium]
MKTLFGIKLAGLLLAGFPAISGEARIVSGLQSPDAKVMLEHGFRQCLSSGGNADYMNGLLAKAGFDVVEWGGMFEHGGGSGYFYVSPDFFCEVSAPSVSTEDAVDIARDVLTEFDRITWTTERDTAGCLMLSSDKLGVVVQSDGQDPICGPIESSSIRVWFGGGE